MRSYLRDKALQIEFAATIQLAVFCLSCIVASSSKSCTSKVNTMEKGKEALNADWLEYDDDSKVVNSLCCKVSTRKEEGITSAKNLSHNIYH